jgi:NADPH2:quinone reductase
MQRRLTLTGSTLRPRSVAEKGEIAAALRRDAWPWIEAGRLRPPIQAVFSLIQAADAHAALEAGDHFGKIVLDVAAAKRWQRAA